MNKKELIDAIAASSKLTKADAGRLGNNSGTGNSALPENLTTSSTVIAYISKQWSKLTELQRIAWNDIAPLYPFKNKFNEPYTGSGYQVYMAINSNLYIVGANLHSFPPVVTMPSLPPINPLTDPPDEHDNVGESMRLLVTGGIPDTQIIMVYGTPPTRPGKSFRKGQEKLLGWAQPNTTGEFNCLYAYQNLFGVPKAGSTVTLRYFVMDITNGCVSNNASITIRYASTLQPYIGFVLDVLSGVNAGAAGSIKWPFRLLSSGLTGPLEITKGADPAGMLTFGKTQDGAFSNSLSVELNQFDQAAQNVFWLNFTPGSAGDKQINIYANSDGVLQKTLPFYGTGVEPSMAGTPSPLAFGDAFIGFSEISSFLLNCQGINDDQYVTVTGPDAGLFKLSENSTGPWASSLMLDPDIYLKITNKPIYVKFTPGTTGAKAANILLQNSGLADVAVPVSGTGVTPSVNWSLSGLDFGTVTNGTTATLPISVSGSGLSAPLNISRSGADAAKFTMSLSADGTFSNTLQLVPSSLGIVPATTIYIKFAPDAVDTFEADLDADTTGMVQVTATLDGEGV